MILIIFIILQVLDLVSTVACLRYGGIEGNPIAAWIMRIVGNPLAGMVWLKIMSIYGGCVIYNSNKSRLLIILNYMFVIVVSWNLLNLIWFTR